jgi:hypothetical protein
VQYAMLNCARARVVYVANTSELRSALANSEVVHVVLTQHLNFHKDAGQGASSELPFVINGLKKTVRVRSTR